MRKLIILFALLLGSLPLSAQDNKITPAPRLFKVGDGELDATQTLKLYMDEYVTDRETLLEAARATGLDIKLVRRPAKQGYINFISDGEYVSEEQYYLYIEEDGIEISAATPAGYFYALQTLRQIVENNPNGKLPLR